MSKTFCARARAVLMVAEYADLHGLPDPHTVNVSVTFGEVTLVFGSTRDVDTWAHQLGASTERLQTMCGGGPAVKAEANATLYEIPVYLYAFDRERVKS